MVTRREHDAMQIVLDKPIVYDDDKSVWLVPSQSRPDVVHHVILWCDCEDFYYRHLTCKHIIAATEVGKTQ